MPVFPGISSVGTTIFAPYRETRSPKSQLLVFWAVRASHTGAPLRAASEALFGAHSRRPSAAKLHGPGELKKPICPDQFAELDILTLENIAGRFRRALLRGRPKQEGAQDKSCLSLFSLLSHVSGIPVSTIP